MPCPAIHAVLSLSESRLHKALLVCRATTWTWKWNMRSLYMMSLSLPALARRQKAGEQIYTGTACAMHVLGSCQCIISHNESQLADRFQAHAAHCSKPPGYSLLLYAVLQTLCIRTSKSIGLSMPRNDINARSQQCTVYFGYRKVPTMPQPVFSSNVQKCVQLMQFALCQCEHECCS